MLDVPRELVDKLAGLLRRERRRRGTRRNSRALSCGKQALLGLVWFRKNEEMTTLAAGFGISRATGYRYRDEVTAVLAAEAPDPMSLRLAWGAGSEAVDLEASGDADDAGLIFAGGEVAGLLGGA